jgi:aldose sugar dehydrogenase
MRVHRVTLFVSVLLGVPIIGCAQPAPSGEPPAAEGWRAVTVASGVRHPWGLTFLRDGRPLVTSKYGTVHVLNGSRWHRIPTDGMPNLFTGGQGGLLDISLHPEYASNGLVYMTASLGTEGQNRLAVLRGRFDGHRIREIRTIFQVGPVKNGGEHFGSRIVWLPDGTMLVSVGDGGNPPRRIDGTLARDHGQRLDSHLGKVLRLNADGSTPADNPVGGREGALPEIWSYGHRNIQGMAIDPVTGRLWASEHGPRGGDELNLLEPGRNFGWPRVTLGRDYRTNEPIGARTLAGMVDPLVAWTPATAPSGLAVYRGNRFPSWRGDLFSGGLVSQDVRRIRVDEGGNVIGQQRLRIGSRVRDVREGPDGLLYVLTDERNGRLIRIEPR